MTRKTRAFLGTRKNTRTIKKHCSASTNLMRRSVRLEDERIRTALPIITGHSPPPHTIQLIAKPQKLKRDQIITRFHQRPRFCHEQNSKRTLEDATSAHIMRVIYKNLSLLRSHSHRYRNRRTVLPLQTSVNTFACMGLHHQPNSTEGMGYTVCYACV